MRKKRFCSWCGKVEYTELCESESMNKVMEELRRKLEGRVSLGDKEE